MRNKIIAILAIYMVSAGSIMFAQELWMSKDGSIRNIDTRAVFIDGRNMYIATKNELYAPNSSKDKWKPIFLIPASDNEIACMSAGAGDIYVGTKRGLYRSRDHGRTWQNVFKTIIPEKSRVMAINMSDFSRGKIAIGTERGFFVSDDRGARWRDSSGIMRNRMVRCITYGNGYIFAGTDDGLYAADGEKYDWRRVIVAAGGSDKEDVSEATSDPVEPDAADVAGVHCVVVKGQTIYITVRKRILFSDDSGKSWKDMSTAGLGGSINAVLTSGRTDKIYCATTKGVFEFDSGKNLWSELSNKVGRLVNVKSIVFASENEKAIWAITDKGLYKLELENFTDGQYLDVEKNTMTMKLVLDGEPAFKELRAAALEFNEISPDKISRWRAEARMKALIPKVSVGFDNARSSNSNIVAAATVPDRDRVIAGPDDIDEGFDLSVSWDLAALIWSDDQTNIDVRSRLTTQLRNDILDDLRRVYFERKRLQYEVISAPPDDARLRFEKELRIQELTQAIDDITGNYLSEHMKEVTD